MRLTAEQAALELEQLKALRAVQNEIARESAARAAKLKADQERAAQLARCPPSPSPGLPRARMCNPRSYVVSADLYELGRALVPANLAELEQKSRARQKGELGPTALCIASVLYVFRGLRGGIDGCGVQAPLEVWSTILGRSRRQVAYAFAQLEARGWVSRRRRLVRHEWTDSQGRTWQRADTHGAAYLHQLGAVQLGPAAWRKDGRRVAIGLVGKLLKLAGSKLRVLARRVTDAQHRCTPSFGEKHDKSFRTRKSARIGRAHSTAPPGPTPSGHPSTQRAEHRGAAERSAAGPQWEGATSAQQAWPELWAKSDARARQWLHAQFVGVQFPRGGASAKLRAARLAWVKRNRR